MGIVAVLKYFHLCFPFAKCVDDGDKVNNPKPCLPQSVSPK
ncbi:hypothetical protein NEIPOLOT_01594 [Neisseria polysaccharea ATCC 43768]|nr:hypothetical protein NEIPOLOT_01594 [Neisseria polysaccharea ATCC 43768]